jgi:hypothetical protein
MKFLGNEKYESLVLLYDSLNAGLFVAILKTAEMFITNKCSVSKRRLFVLLSALGCFTKRTIYMPC